MGMFDLFREDSKYPGWDFLIGFFGMFLTFATLGVGLAFSPLGHWLLQGTPDYVDVVKITLWTAIKTSWFYFVLMFLGIFLTSFGGEGFGTTDVVNIIKKIFIFIKGFLKSKKVKRVIFFSLSVIYWVISILTLYSIGDNFKDFYRHVFYGLYALAMLTISTGLVFFATFSQEDTLFKKPW